MRHLRCHALLARVEFTSLTNPTTVSTVYFQHDGHGNVALKSDSNGNAIRGYKYDAFGNILNPNASDTNPFRYCGEYYDAETGTYYLRARHYWSDLGRFTQEDTHWNTGNMVYGDEPVTLSRGLPGGEYSLPSVLAVMQSGNLYVYCGNDPVLYMDSTGNFAATLFGVAFGAINGGINAYFMGTDVRSGAFSGAVGGGIAGLGVDFGGVGAIVVAAMLGGAASSAINQYVNTGSVDLETVAISASISGFFGTGIYGMDKLMSSVFPYAPQGNTWILKQIDSLLHTFQYPTKDLLSQFLTNSYLEIPKWIADTLATHSSEGGSR